MLGKVIDAHVIDESSCNPKFPLYSSLVQLLCYQENHPNSLTVSKRGPVATVTLFTIQVAVAIHHHVVILFPLNCYHRLRRSSSWPLRHPVGRPLSLLGSPGCRSWNNISSASNLFGQRDGGGKETNKKVWYQVYYHCGRLEFNPIEKLWKPL